MSTREYRPSRLVTRITSLFRRASPPEQRETTTGQTSDPQADLYAFTVKIGQNRVAAYRDIEDMDEVSPEASRALDVLADNAVNSPGGTLKTFTVRFDDGRPVTPEQQAIILDLLDRTHMDDNIYTIGRYAIAMGDDFQQVLVGADGRISGLVRMPPDTMKRNEDQNGRLKRGNKEGSWAFEQYKDGFDFVAGFYPWQIEHIRWNRPGDSKYGRSALHAARYPFKKLQAMEEALVINWLTRAFARLLFQLDTTGMSKKEAEQYLKQFMDQLSRRTVNEDTQGTERLTVAKDLAIGNGYKNMGGKWEQSLNDVKVLDTSNTGFWNISAVEYWRNKLMIATGVPKAHLNIEEDISNVGTLKWQDERFARTVRRIQMMLSGFLHHIIDLELLLHGIDPNTVDYVIEWPTPSTQDETDKADTMLKHAQAAEIMLRNGVVDVEHIQDKWLGISPAQRKRIQIATRETMNGRADARATEEE